MFCCNSAVSIDLLKSEPFSLGAISWNIGKSNAIAEPIRAEENPMRVCALRKILLLISSLVAFNTAILVVRFSVIRCAWIASHPE